MEAAYASSLQYDDGGLGGIVAFKSYIWAFTYLTAYEIALEIPQIMGRYSEMYFAIVLSYCMALSLDYFVRKIISAPTSKTTLFLRRAIASYFDDGIGIPIVMVIVYFLDQAILDSFPQGINQTFKLNLFLMLSIYGIYHIVSIRSLAQATFGKWIMEIRVTNLAGDRVSFFQAFSRFWLRTFSFISVIGILIAAFPRKGRAFHDIACKTQVTSINTSPSPTPDT